MENNEVLENTEEVVETLVPAAEAAPLEKSVKKNSMFAFGLGLAIPVATIMLYKHAIKPIIAKMKSKKAQDVEAKIQAELNDEDYFVEETDTETETEN